MGRSLFLVLAGLPALAGLASAPAGARSVRPSCTLSVTASADGDSFRAAGYDSSPARLSTLAKQARDRFIGAAFRLCSAGVLKPADLARFGALVIQNGEGATEPVIYREPSMEARTFIFQFAFQDGGPPAPEAFEQALRCWKRPQGCDFGD